MNGRRTKRWAKHVLLFIVLFLLSLPLLPFAGHSPTAFGHATNEVPRLLTIAHRGASGYAPENTLAAYRLSLLMNADYLELDLQLTKDGEIVVMHDRTVNRTTNGKGEIRRMTLTEIKALDAGSWFNEKHPMYAREEYADEKVPTLREVFETFGNRANYLLETKTPADNPGLEEKMWSLVKQYGMDGHVAIQSFSKKSLRKIRKWDPNILLYQLIWYRHPSTITWNKLNGIKKYANGIGVNYNKINEDYVRKVKESGLSIIPYTLNYQIHMDRAVRWGVDGIHTDYPDRLQEVLAHYRPRRVYPYEQHEETVRQAARPEREYSR